MADPRFNANHPPAFRVVTQTAITTNASGMVNVSVPMRRVRKAIVGYQGLAANGQSGNVNVQIASISGATVRVQASQSISGFVPIASGYILSGGTLTTWAEGDK